jgi:hypothetical protein
MIGHEHKDKYHPNHPSVDQSDRPVLRLDGQRGYRSRGLEVLWKSSFWHLSVEKGYHEVTTNAEAVWNSILEPLKNHDSAAKPVNFGDRSLSAPCRWDEIRTTKSRRSNSVQISCA